MTKHAPTFEDLRFAIARRIATEGPLASQAFAETIANLALSAVSTLYPDGWDIVGLVPTTEGGTVQGVDDGISRLDLLGYLSADYYGAGHEEQVYYRSNQISITYGMGDAYAMLDDIDGHPSFHVDDTNYGSSPATVLRDLDTWIDALFAHGSKRDRS
jgi:hypothetical protein